MKKTLLILSVITLVVTSCNFSAGTKADLVSGLSSTWNGLSAETIYFVDQEDQSITNKQVSWNTECSFVFEGISNYTLKDGNAFPGITLTVTDPSGAEVVAFDDMLASYTEGVSPTDAGVLRATLTVGDPMKVGETYTVTARVFDKQNAEAEIVSKVSVKVVE
ncbi:MAG: hypothetical protein KF725_10890 [Cyclobacteriaceae bacterium]|nr:hypothetical protein [Cyclobacteriaceae bacterium]UYN86212.1 MAG: hypothetical protein KIT51_15280 [Cyclobacteriaceae bacterium]